MKRILNTALATTVLAFATQSFAAATTTKPATATASISPAERSKIESVVHDYLMKHPEVIYQSVQALQAKQYQEAEKTVKQTQKNASSFADKLFHASNDPVAGNPNGKVTVVEFFDYQCPHCLDMAPVIEGIIKANPDVRVVFKDFPIRGPVSEFAAQAALAANKQGKYYDFSHALLTATTQPLTNDAVMTIAKNAGLNVDQLQKDMKDGSITDQLKATMKLAQDLKLFGTPAIFIGKTDASGANSIMYVPGQMNQKQLQDAIDKAKS